MNGLGMLKKLRRVPSVSGGSTTTAPLGMKWKKLKFEHGVATNLNAEVVELT